ncbi:MAG TPA: response regulator [Bacteroidia bacterium]|jgi:CheY-like chemotaxis protein|nr:response regulator [Bacteroidia bacterium]
MKLEQIVPFNILLADDDVDDYTFFKEALKDFPLTTNLTWLHNGEELMQHLANEANEIPDILFLDLNMSRKNGFECLSEIKLNERLKDLPIIIYSTSFHNVIAHKLHKNGANYYISKPSEISELKKAVQKMITLVKEENILQPAIEDFVLTNERKNYKTHFWFSHFFRLPSIEKFN